MQEARADLVECFGYDSETEYDATALAKRREHRPMVPVGRIRDVGALQHLETHGQACIPLASETVAMLDAYIPALIASYDEWFQSLLRRGLGRPGDEARAAQAAGRDAKRAARMAKAEEKWAAGRDAFRALTGTAKQSALSPFTMKTREGRRRIMDNKARLSHLNGVPYGKYLADQIRWAVNGGSASNMGASVGRSVSQSGFGIGVFMHHTPLVRVMLEVQRIVYQTLGLRFFIGGRPEILFKVGGGSKLAVHHDEQRPYRLLLDCLENVDASPTCPNHTWMNQHGVQTIVHLEGATVSGNTFTLSNMSPWRMLVCLLLVHHKHVHPEMRCPVDMRAWWDSIGKDGPVFLAWDHPANLRVMNRVVSRLQGMMATGPSLPSAMTEFEPVDHAWVGQLHAVHPGFLHRLLRCTSPLPSGTIAPLPIQRHDDPAQSKYLGIWLAGFFHGSLPTDTDRITIVPHMKTRPLERAETDIIAAYHERAAEYASTDDDAARAAILAWWKRHRQPEHGGSAHVRVVTELELAAGHFRRLSPTPAEAAEFRRVLEFEAQTGRVWCEHGGANAVSRWRMMTLDNPWGQLICDGHKLVENRPKATATCASFLPGSWVAIHTSATKYEAVSSDTHPHVPSMYHQIHRPSCGKIVGLARVGRVLPSTVARAEPILAPWVSPDPDKYCIVWDQVIKLHHPVATTGGQGQPFLTDAPVHCTNAKGQPKTPEQLERATVIAMSRRSAAVHIEQALAQGSYTMIVHPLS